ncbi:hypothetical protein A139_00001 [Escherichia coli KTE181]|nr:hypothetical protein A139_00001 [Escherichia coli KTE181]
MHDGIALSTGMFFPYRPDNPEGATHQLQLFGGALLQIVGGDKLIIPFC